MHKQYNVIDITEIKGRNNIMRISCSKSYKTMFANMGESGELIDKNLF